MAREKTAKEEQKYSKSDFLEASKYSNCRDILEVILSEGNGYSVEEVDSKLQEFKEREVL